MAINLVKGEIKIILETLTEQFITISQYQEKIPQIEIDIIMANIRKLYERYCDLNDLNKKTSHVKTDNVAYQENEEKPEIEPIVEIKSSAINLTVASNDIDKEQIDTVDKENLFNENLENNKEENREIEPIVEIIASALNPTAANIDKEHIDNAVNEDLFQKDVENKKEENKKEIPEIEPVVEIKPITINPSATPKEMDKEHNDTFVKEDLFDDHHENNKEQKPSHAELLQKSKKEKSKSGDLFFLTEKETIADMFKEAPKSVHEKISGEKSDETLAEKFGKSAIPNLKSAIGINDKFLFINQLFKGDLQEYNKTMDKLNTCTTIDMATIALEDLRTANNWDNGDDAYQKLEDLVIRKLL